MATFIEGAWGQDKRPTIHFILPEGRAIIRDKGERKEGIAKDIDIYMPVENPDVSLWTHIQNKMRTQGMVYVTHFNFPPHSATSSEPLERKKLRQYRELENELLKLPKYEPNGTRAVSSEKTSERESSKSNGGSRKKAGQVTGPAENSI